MGTAGVWAASLQVFSLPSFSSQEIGSHAPSLSWGAYFRPFLSAQFCSSLGTVLCAPGTWERWAILGLSLSIPEVTKHPLPQLAVREGAMWDATVRKLPDDAQTAQVGGGQIESDLRPLVGAR